LRQPKLPKNFRTPDGPFSMNARIDNNKFAQACAIDVRDGLQINDKLAEPLAHQRVNPFANKLEALTLREPATYDKDCITTLDSNIDVHVIPLKTA
jgi:hypothetical protein